MNDLVVSAPSAWGLATYPPGAGFGPRRAQDYEFVWMIEGSAHYESGATALDAPAGSLLLCSPSPSQHFHWDSERRTRHAYFHFQIGSVPDDWPPRCEWPVIRTLPENDIIRPLFRYVLAQSGAPDSPQLRLSVSLILTAFVLGDLSAGSVAREVWPGAVQEACAYIYRTLEAYPAARLTLPQLAAAVCITPEHLCRLFASSIGHSPVETVRLARLDYAVGLLARSNYTIAQISGICGFANPYHFSRLFKSVYGLTPTAVRESAHAGLPLPSPKLVHHSDVVVG